jgi:hypothetical protein
MNRAHTLTNRLAIVLAEVSSGLAVRNKAAGQPLQLNLRARVALRLGAVLVAAEGARYSSSYGSELSSCSSADSAHFRAISINVSRCGPAGTSFDEL